MLLLIVTSLLLLAKDVSSFSLTSSAIGRVRAASPSSSTALDMALTLYGHPGTRSPLVNWACYELGIEIAAGDLRANPHPFGQIPCLTDDDAVVFESGAILAYLVQNYSDKAKLTKAQKASILSWIVWANASLDPICFLETPEGKVYDTGLRQPNKRIDRLESMLKENGGVLVPSAGFSVADVAVASYLLYVVQFFPSTDVSRWPNIMTYMKEAASRPTYGQAFGKQTQEYMVGKLSSAPPKKMFGMF